MHAFEFQFVKPSVAVVATGPTSVLPADPSAVHGGARGSARTRRRPPPPIHLRPCAPVAMRVT